VLTGGEGGREKPVLAFSEKKRTVNCRDGCPHLLGEKQFGKKKKERLRQTHVVIIHTVKRSG